jgi:hypothetical protein
MAIDNVIASTGDTLQWVSQKLNEHPWIGYTMEGLAFAAGPAKWAIGKLLAPLTDGATEFLANATAERAAGLGNQDARTRALAVGVAGIASLTLGYLVGSNIGRFQSMFKGGLAAVDRAMAGMGQKLVALRARFAGVAKGLTTADFPTIGTTVSQKQLRHIAGRPEFAARGGGGYFNSVDDAQAVLDAYHSGSATILGKSPQGFPIVRFDGITGTNVNVGAGIRDQATNVFMIKGTSRPSVVPTNPFWKPK